MPRLSVSEEAGTLTEPTEEQDWKEKPPHGRRRREPAAAGPTVAGPTTVEADGGQARERHAVCSRVRSVRLLLTLGTIDSGCQIGGTGG